MSGNAALLPDLPLLSGDQLEWLYLLVMSKRYSISEFAKRIGRSPQTIRCWEIEDELQAKLLASGHRYFDESEVRLMLGGVPKRRDVVVYCRVSSAGQQDDLASQVRACE